MTKIPRHTLPTIELTIVYLLKKPPSQDTNNFNQCKNLLSDIALVSQSRINNNKSINVSSKKSSNILTGITKESTPIILNIDQVP